MECRAASRRRLAHSAAWSTLLLLCLPAPAAWAHADPQPLALWGPFLPGTQTCLRRISSATHACFDRVVGLEQACRDAQARGEACDETALEAALSAADSGLRATLADACEEGQLTELSYIGLFDAGLDLNLGCIGEGRNAAAAIYAPARAGAVSSDAARCLAATAAYGRKVMRFALERQVPINERMATRLIDGEEKRAAVLRVARELSADLARWSSGLLAVCPDFEAVYGRSPESVLRTLKQRVDCVLSRTYVHDALICLPPTCGNGIPEGDEACDDGNQNAADVCRNDCSASGAG